MKANGIQWYVVRALALAVGFVLKGGGCKFLIMSKYIELAKKLKALADRGIGGEKINAEKMLNALMKKHKISIEDIEGEKQEDCNLKEKQQN